MRINTSDIDKYLDIKKQIGYIQDQIDVVEKNDFSIIKNSNRSINIRISSETRKEIKELIISKLIREKQKLEIECIQLYN